MGPPARGDRVSGELFLLLGAVRQWAAGREADIEFGGDERVYYFEDMVFTEALVFFIFCL